MRALRFGDRGADVRKLNRQLNRFCGYPYIKNSQHFNEDTDSELRQFQSSFGLEPDGIYGPLTQGDLRMYFKQLPYRKMSEVDHNQFFKQGRFIDLRSIVPPPRLASGAQDITNIQGVTLHQMGCTILPHNAERLGRINAHFLVLKDGVVIFLHDPRHFIWHGQGLSYFTMGIEIEGNYAGIEGQPWTVWKPQKFGGPDKLSPAMLEGFANLRLYLKAWFFRQEMRWTCVMAHRQATENRPWCPGQEIWQKVGEPWSAGVSPMGELTLGSGQLKPKEWCS